MYKDASGFVGLDICDPVHDWFMMSCSDSNIRPIALDMDLDAPCMPQSAMMATLLLTLVVNCHGRRIVIVVFLQRMMTPQRTLEDTRVHYERTPTKEERHENGRKNERLRECPNDCRTLRPKTRCYRTCPHE
eukprot:5764473-Amphidinium_carterae.2